ncbi:MAG TPA: DUF4388 domain-containing protein [Polyangiaceae bacterium]
MSQARRAALHLLNNDWSRAVWKHWLAHVFEPPVTPPMPSKGAPVEPGATDRVNTAPASRDDDGAQLTSSCVPDQGEAPDSQGDRGARRGELRARFEALSDRLLAVEDGLAALLRRSSQREKSERRSEQQQVELIDTLAIAAERQATVLEGLLGTVARLEHALSRLEHGLSRVERGVGDRNRRDSHAPAAGQRYSSQFPESQAAPRDRSGSEVDELDANDAPGINGQLSDMSLSTVLAMLEIERHSGRLKVATDEGLLASFELSEGSVVSSRLSDNDADPLQTLRTALRWKQGRFWFRQQPAEAQTFPPRSIGSLLLEATRQNDESFADVG